MGKANDVHFLNDKLNIDSLCSVVNTTKAEHVQLLTIYAHLFMIFHVRDNLFWSVF